MCNMYNIICGEIFIKVVMNTENKEVLNLLSSFIQNLFEVHVRKSFNHIYDNFTMFMFCYVTLITLVLTFRFTLTNISVLLL